MNTKQFLQIGGIVLIVVGILGFAGLIGPTIEQSIFGAAWWFDNAENVAHLFLGIVAIVVLYLLPQTTHKPVVLLVGVVALLFGLYSLFGEVQFLGANLQNPTDTVLHLVVGVWALYSALHKEGMTV